MIISRKIELRDNEQVEILVKTIMTELGCSGPGFSLHDEELKNMFDSYNKPAHLFLVLVEGEKILGCAGVGSLAGKPKVCELKKMYFYPEVRSKGLATHLMTELLEFAKAHYEGIYIETMDHMTAANKLYLKSGFKPISKPMGSTGHFGCNTFYYLDFTSFSDQS